jgi:hypothetical protein
MSAEFDQPGDERIAELLVQEWETGLTPSERMELRRLLAFSDEIAPDDFEYAAAVLHLAFAAADEQPLPSDLRKRILSTALGPGAGHTPDPTGHRSKPPTFGGASELPDPGEASSPVLAEDPVRRGRRPTIHPGWVAALAAGLVLGAAGWLRPWEADPALRDRDRDRAERAEAPVPAEPAAPPAPAERLEALKAAEGPRLVRARWKPTDDPHLKGHRVDGEVVWSPKRQEGYMTFDGMPANDPSAHQYQLWVFDAERDERFPVDGGVFDIPEGPGPVVVPIRTPIPVGRAQLFAVTLEAPGGVVVSDREHVLTLGEPDRS